jgi:hypothetical protein
MKKIFKRLWLLIFFLGIFNVLQASQAFGLDEPDDSADNPASELVVLWTSGDLEVAKKMVFMYVYNAKKYEWWNKITFIIWGPSSKLLANNVELQNILQKMKTEGIQLKACKACSDQYGVTEKLKQLGVEVKYMGKPLTEYIKEGYKIITF